MAKVKTRKYSWKDLVDKADGPEVPIPVYKFSGNRRITENPKRPYGPRRMD